LKAHNPRGYALPGVQRITTKEARKLLGKAYANLSDEQIDRIVSLLDFIAKDAIQK
jgi:hypothetical protein